MPSKAKKPKLFNAVLLESKGEELRAYLRDFVQELTAEVSRTAPDHSEEVLNTLIVELALSAADQRRSKERKLHQKECIAAAKERGVHFGRPRAPLPDDFDKCHRAWRNGELSLQKAADSCGMEKTTFQRAALRKEQSMEHTVC